MRRPSTRRRRLGTGCGAGRRRIGMRWRGSRLGGRGRSALLDPGVYRIHVPPVPTEPCRCATAAAAAHCARTAAAPSPRHTGAVPRDLRRATGRPLMRHDRAAAQLLSALPGGPRRTEPRCAMPCCAVLCRAVPRPLPSLGACRHTPRASARSPAASPCRVPRSPALNIEASDGPPSTAARCSPVAPVRPHLSPTVDTSCVRHRRWLTGHALSCLPALAPASCAARSGTGTALPPVTFLWPLKYTTHLS